MGIIRIYHECAGGIEKYVPRITVWHHEACRVTTNGDPEGLNLFSISSSHEYWILFLAHHRLFILNHGYNIDKSSGQAKKKMVEDYHGMQ